MDILHKKQRELRNFAEHGVSERWAPPQHRSGVAQSSQRPLRQGKGSLACLMLARLVSVCCDMWPDTCGPVL